MSDQRDQGTRSEMVEWNIAHSTSGHRKPNLREDTSKPIKVTFWCSTCNPSNITEDGTFFPEGETKPHCKKCKAMVTAQM